jgi:hypothetical protein
MRPEILLAFFISIFVRAVRATPLPPTDDVWTHHSNKAYSRSYDLDARSHSIGNGGHHTLEAMTEAITVTSAAHHSSHHGADNYRTATTTARLRSATPTSAVHHAGAIAPSAQEAHTTVLSSTHTVTSTRLGLPKLMASSTAKSSSVDVASSTRAESALDDGKLGAVQTHMAESKDVEATPYTSASRTSHGGADDDYLPVETAVKEKVERLPLHPIPSLVPAIEHDPVSSAPTAPTSVRGIEKKKSDSDRRARAFTAFATSEVELPCVQTLAASPRQDLASMDNDNMAGYIDIVVCGLWSSNRCDLK